MIKYTSNEFAALDREMCLSKFELKFLADKKL